MLLKNPPPFFSFVNILSLNCNAYCTWMLDIRYWIKVYSDIWRLTPRFLIWYRRFWYPAQSDSADHGYWTESLPMVYGRHSILLRQQVTFPSNYVYCSLSSYCKWWNEVDIYCKHSYRKHLPVVFHFLVWWQCSVCLLHMSPSQPQTTIDRPSVDS
jgi:hypothetical protein